MTKEQQDLSWQCLSKEIRWKIKKTYNFQAADKNYNRGYNEALELCFGHHNLTSDEEPSELLFVERENVIGYYKDVQQAIGEENGDTKIEMEGRMYAMIYLFGDKCLPDKEPSVQREPKFNVGDKVIIATKPYDIWWDGIVKTIKNIELNEDGIYLYSFYDYNYSVEEYDLHPYTEPETKDNSNMEEKELNLVELLKGCEKEKFYSPMLSDVFIAQLRETSIHIVPCDEGHSERFLFIDKCGVWTKGGQCVLYPSRALYEKYPLDAAKAWQIWEEERNPKRWRAERNKEYWYIDGALDVCCGKEEHMKTDEKRHIRGNYFRTEEEAQQAAEAARACLAKFHEQNKTNMDEHTFK